MILTGFNIFLHFKSLENDKEISKLKQEKIFLEKKSNLLKINWNFLTRPENLNLLNAQKFNYSPINVEDEFKLNKIKKN